MNKLIEMPEDLFARLEQAAASRGLTPMGWLDANLPANGNGTVPVTEAQPETLAERFAGRVGVVASGGDGRLSENTGEKFADYLVERRRMGRL